MYNHKVGRFFETQCNYTYQLRFSWCC